VPRSLAARISNGMRFSETSSAEHLLEWEELERVAAQLCEWFADPARRGARRAASAPRVVVP
jgi:hypothetical protein